MKVLIRPSKLKGTVAAPASKSVAHRLLLAAALSQGTSVLGGIETNEDLEATIDCLRLIGAGIQSMEDGSIHVRGGDLRLPEGVIFPLRESGSTFRFMIPVALSLSGEARFIGSQRLMERGVRIYEELFREKGIVVEPSEGMLRIKGKLEAGDYRLSGAVSSQFISGLLFALPALPGDSVIEIVPPVGSRPYIELTMDALRRFGVRTDFEGENVISVPGGQRFVPSVQCCEGDWTNGSVLLALRALGHAVTVEGLDPGSPQGDRAFVTFEKMLRDEHFPEIDLQSTPDLGPVLFVLASSLHGAVFTGVERLRLKESDRLQAMSLELRKFGAEVEVHDHSVIVYPSVLKSPSEALQSHNDHRVVMALSLLATIYGGEIEDAEAVKKSWPAFFDTLCALGASVGITEDD
jgi:3-phosphoshikimate 1-carboxyvinyltransferase